MTDTIDKVNIKSSDGMNEDEFDMLTLENDLFNKYLFNNEEDVHNQNGDSNRIVNDSTEFHDTNSKFAVNQSNRDYDHGNVENNEIFDKFIDPLNTNYTPMQQTSLHHTTVNQEIAQKPKMHIKTEGQDDAQYQELIDNTIVFGREEPINEEYLDPRPYMNVGDNELPYTLSVEGLPKISRVENQIKLSLKISPSINKFMVYLPTDSIIRQKFYLNKDIGEYSKSFQDQLVYLKVFLLDAATYEDVKVCIKCVKREQRRASRRKSGLSDNMLWCNSETRSAIIFNNKQISTLHDVNNEYKDFELITRIVCYCRHHKANEGFRILFVLTDASNNMLAKSTSETVMITDKKLNSLIDDNSNSASSSSVPTLSNGNKRGKGSTKDNHVIENVNTITTNDSRHNSYSTQLPNRIIPSPTSMSEEGSESFTSEYISSHHNYSSMSTTASFIGRENQQYRKRSRNNSSHTNTMFQRQSSLSNLQTHALSMNVTDFNSFGLTNPQMLSLNQIGQTNNDAIDVDTPSIDRVVPSKGPINGGIEVTLLGSKFKEGLIVKFGENLALSTQCWSDTTIVTYLPPAVSAGQVFVTITDPNSPNTENTNSNMSRIHPSRKGIFTYIDETDRQLIELALQIVGLKMNGKLEDARNIAKRIVGEENSSNPSPNNTNYSPNSSNHQLNTSPDELLVVKVIKSLNRTTSNLSMCDSMGRTLLHMAAFKGYFELVAILVKSGVNVDSRDMFGYTPLHFAAVNGNFKIIRLLLTCKSKSNSKAGNSLNPQDLYFRNHDRTESEFEDICDLFDYFSEEKNMNDLPNLNRVSSEMSFGSSVFDCESVTSSDTRHRIDDNSRPTFTILDESNSEWEECDFEDNDEYDSEDSDLIDDGPIDENMPNVSRAYTTIVNGIDHSSPSDNSLWNRMINRINDDLPKYEDLFPKFPLSEKSKSLEESAIITNSECSDIQGSAGLTTEDSHTSSEDEEEAVQRLFNRLFHNNKQTFQNDKMLLFFWIPLTLILIMWFVLIKISSGPESFINRINNFAIDCLRFSLAKVLLGNQRVKTMFMDKISNLQNAGILNDLIVS